MKWLKIPTRRRKIWSRNWKSKYYDAVETTSKMSKWVENVRRDRRRTVVCRDVFAQTKLSCRWVDHLLFCSVNLILPYMCVDFTSPPNFMGWDLFGGLGLRLRGLQPPQAQAWLRPYISSIFIALCLRLVTWCWCDLQDADNSECPTSFTALDHQCQSVTVGFGIGL